MPDYQIKTTTDTYLIYELIEESTQSWVKICPERGGIVIGYGVHAQELLYLDKETFYNPEANIRGGIPILFPICGQLLNSQYELEGELYTMKNHGVARTLAWEVAGTSNNGQATLTLRLRSNSATLESYPFEFELLFTYVLKDGTLHINQEYRNLSDRKMPMYTGLHPYFAADHKDIAYETDATRYLDCNDNQEKAYQGSLDLSNMVESAYLIDPLKSEISFQPSTNQRIHMQYSDQFKYIVLWTVQGKPFVCVEPWMAKNNEMNIKQELTYISPNETLHAELIISSETIR